VSENGLAKTVVGTGIETAHALSHRAVRVEYQHVALHCDVNENGAALPVPSSLDKPMSRITSA
jgi:hypothetical protein